MRPWEQQLCTTHPGSPSLSLIAAFSPDQAPSPLGLPMNHRTSFVPLRDTLCSQSNVTSLGAWDTALQAPVFWSRAPGHPPCDHFTHLPSHRETTVCVCVCERETYECVCVFCLPNWAAASQGQGQNPSQPLLTHPPSKLQRESIYVWETISLHPLLGKPCLDQMTGGCCVPIPGMSCSSENTGHLSMAWSWFDSSGGAPGSWGPGWKRRRQSEKREGDTGQQSCGGLRKEPGEGSPVELG